MKLELDSYATFLFTALSMMAVKNNSTIMPDALYLLSPDQLDNFLEVFGGERIYIPTKKELSQTLKAALVYYYMTVEGKTRFSAFEQLKISPREARTIISLIKQYKEKSDRERITRQPFKDA